MLGESPEVMRFIVKGEECRHLEDHHASRTQGHMDPVKCRLIVVHVLEHVEAEDHVELASEFHARGVDDGVSETRVDVRLNELVGWVEEAPDRVALFAEILPSASELEDPTPAQTSCPTTHVPVHPAPVTDEGVGEAPRRSAYHRRADYRLT